MRHDRADVHLVVVVLAGRATRKIVVVDEGARRRRRAPQGDAQVPACGGAQVCDGVGVGDRWVVRADGCVAVEHDPACCVFGGGRRR